MSGNKRRMASAVMGCAVVVVVVVVVVDMVVGVDGRRKGGTRACAELGDGESRGYRLEAKQPRMRDEVKINAESRGDNRDRDGALRKRTKSKGKKINWRW